MKEQVDGKVKEERSKRIIQLSNKCQEEFLNKYLNRKVKVLFEEKENQYVKGHTSNYIAVKTKDNVKENQITDIKIQEQSNLELFGRIL